MDLKISNCKTTIFNNSFEIKLVHRHVKNKRNEVKKVKITVFCQGLNVTIFHDFTRLSLNHNYLQ